MTTRRVVLSVAVSAMICLLLPAAAQAQGRIYNTVKQKLMDGKKVVGGTVSTSDPNIYCAMANSGFDFLWIEMQHSPLMYNDVAKMIWACKDAPAIPFIRIPRRHRRRHPESDRHWRPWHRRSHGSHRQRGSRRGQVREIPAHGTPKPRRRAVRRNLG